MKPLVRPWVCSLLVCAQTNTLRSRGQWLKNFYVKNFWVGDNLLAGYHFYAALSRKILGAGGICGVGAFRDFLAM
jgi:hypothetical protein